MTKQEFEKLAGYEVTQEDYTQVIEPMYMATEMQKEDFVKCLSRERFALPTKRQVINKMKNLAGKLYDLCGRRSDYKTEMELDKLVREYAERFHSIDWSHDMTSYVFFLKGYEYPEIQRGCTYPKTLCIGKCGREIERIELVKEGK